MDELRFVRRDDLSLVVANDAGEEFRLIVDDTVLSELRHLSRRERSMQQVRPREIQSLLRSGKSRAEVARETGLSEADIERYEEPVLAERRYLLERAQAVSVRVESHDEDEQRFGAVIAERLVGLGAEVSEWSAWKDDETGWMIGLEFISHDVSHRAVWSFDHRKSVLSAVNPDAVNLSRQGDVGERLIPKLRAVDSSERSERFDSGAFRNAELPIPDLEDAPSAAETDGGADPEPERPAQGDAGSEYARRMEIDSRAVKTEQADAADLSQTADLLDALRKRRGEREQTQQEAERADHPSRGEAPAAPAAPERPSPSSSSSSGESAPLKPRSIWSASGVTGGQDSPEPARPAAPRGDAPQPEASRSENSRSETPKSEAERGGRKGRASIPSWDDILFGTRSDEDPA